eukprot:4723984-Prymnesium_polylepis.1
MTPPQATCSVTSPPRGTSNRTFLANGRGRPSDARGAAATGPHGPCGLPSSKSGARATMAGDAGGALSGERAFTMSSPPRTASTAVRGRKRAVAVTPTQLSKQRASRPNEKDL